LLEHLPHGVLVLEEGRVLRATGPAEEVLGRARSRLEGADGAEVLPAEALEAAQRVLDGASSCTVRSLPFAPPACSRVTVTASPGPSPGQVVLLLDGDSDPAGHAAAEGFRRRLAWLDSLAAGMAHEIRNPLGGIRGAAQLLARGPEPDDLDELCGLIIQEADRIDGIVERLMDLVRPRRLERGSVSLNRLVHDEVLLLRAHFGEGIDWALDLDPSLPELEGDARRLREAVGNLLRNAREAAAGRVEVRTRVEAGGRFAQEGHDRGLVLRLDVVDDGPGIPEDQLGRLFDPFSTSKPQGTGLGLFVSRLTIDDHGGQLEVEPGPGARFTVLLSERLP